MIRRTGLNIETVGVSKIDFLRDTAQLTITYLPDTVNVEEVFTGDAVKDNDVIAGDRA